MSDGRDPFVEGWAQTVVDETLRRLEAECQANGSVARWEVFRLRELGPKLDGVAPPPYEELVGRLGFRSPAEASNALITAKRAFARLFREVVSEYTGAGADVEEEIRELRLELNRS